MLPSIGMALRCLLAMWIGAGLYMVYDPKPLLTISAHAHAAAGDFSHALTSRYGGQNENPQYRNTSAELNDLTALHSVSPATCSVITPSTLHYPNREHVGESPSNLSIFHAQDCDLGLSPDSSFLDVLHDPSNQLDSSLQVPFYLILTASFFFAVWLCGKAVLRHVTALHRGPQPPIFGITSPVIEMPVVPAMVLSHDFAASSGALNLHESFYNPCVAHNNCDQLKKRCNTWITIAWALLKKVKTQARTIATQSATIASQSTTITTQAATIASQEDVNAVLQERYGKDRSCWLSRILRLSLRVYVQAATIATQIRTIATQSTTITSQSTTIASQSTTIASQSTTITTQAATIASQEDMNAVLLERYGKDRSCWLSRILRLSLRVYVQAATINHLTATISRQVVSITEQAHTITGHVNTLASQAEEITALSKDIAALRQGKQDLRTHNALLREDSKALNESLELVVQEAAHSQAAHQDKISVLTSARDSLLLRGDETMRQLKAAQAEAVESQHSLVQYQSDRAKLFNKFAMITTRHESVQETSVSSSEGTPPTSPDTDSDGRWSSIKPSLDASATEFAPALRLRPNSTQDTILSRKSPQDGYRIRPGRLARQLRRPITAAKRVKIQSKGTMHLSPKVQMNMKMQIIVTMPRLPLRLPSGGRFDTAGSSFNLTIWRLRNDTALIAIQRSPDSEQSSCGLFDFEIAHFQSQYSPRHVFHCCDQSTKLLLTNSRGTSTHESTLMKVILGAIMRAKNRPTLLPSIMPAEASPSKSPSSILEDPMKSVAGAAAKATCPTVEAHVVDKPFTSIWALKPCRFDPNCRKISCTFGHPKRAMRARTPCKMFIAGICMRGEACDFKHVTNTPPQAPPSPQPASNASAATTLPVLPCAPEPVAQIDEVQVKKRAVEIKADRKNWRLTLNEAEVQARDEQKVAAEAARAKAKSRAERAAKRAVDAAKASVEDDFQQKVILHHIKVTARATQIKLKGAWNMTFAMALDIAKDELKGEDPTR